MVQRMRAERVRVWGGEKMGERTEHAKEYPWTCDENTKHSNINSRKGGGASPL